MTCEGHVGRWLDALRDDIEDWSHLRRFQKLARIGIIDNLWFVQMEQHDCFIALKRDSSDSFVEPRPHYA